MDVDLNSVLARLPMLGFTNLPLKIEHLKILGHLPFHHRDPFDRVLIAQAKCEGMTVLSADPHFQQYDVDLLTV